MKHLKILSTPEIPEPRLWGHRGCRGEGHPPENTLPAFLQAVAEGADGIEFDLYQTADGQIVIFHDDLLDRLTDGSGSLKSKTLVELKQLRVLEQGTIPTFEELLEALGPIPGFTYNIELKDPNALEGMVRIVQAALANGFKPEHFLISTFERAMLPEISLKLPNIRLGALYDDNEPLTPPPCPVYSYHLLLERCDEALIQAIWAAGAIPIAWTFNEVRPAENPNLWRIKAFNLILITDYPKEMREALTQENPPSFPEEEAVA